MEDMAAPLQLLASEDEDAYDLIRIELTDAIQPTDFVEWLWVNDLTDQVWEERRAKHAKLVRLKLTFKEIRDWYTKNCCNMSNLGSRK